MKELHTTVNEDFFPKIKDMFFNYIGKLIKPNKIESSLNKDHLNIKYSKYTSGEVTVDEDAVTITGISFKSLLRRIKYVYKDKNIENVFQKTYTDLSIYLYNKKLINKENMEIKEIYFNKFFALEVAKIFEKLYDIYGYSFYLKIFQDIYNKTWIKDLDSKEKIPMDTSRLKNIKYELNDYQLDFIKNYKTYKNKLNLNGFILAFDQGLGKTLTSVSLSECLNPDSVFIVCPNAVKEQWSNEIKSYYGYSNEEWKEKVFICNNSNYKFGRNTKFIITNNESIPLMYPYTEAYKNPVLIVDEIHNFRNINGKRVVDLLELQRKLGSKDNLLLSGTPIKAIPSEIVPALSLIDPMFTREVSLIYNRAFNSRKESVTEIVNERFGMVMHVKKKKQVLKLPNREEHTLRLNIPNPSPYTLSSVSNEIRRRFLEIYGEKLKESPRLEIEFKEYIIQYSSSSKKDLDFYLKWVDNDVLDGSIHEITKEFLKEYPEKYVIPNIKDRETRNKFIKIHKEFISMKRHSLSKAIGEILPPLRENMFIELFDQNLNVIKEIIENSVKKVIIFSTMKSVVNHINDRLNQIEPGSSLKVHGDIKGRDQIVETFKNTDDVKTLIATSQTIGTGVNLVEANTIIFFGTPWRSTDYDQACDRIYRIGQNVEVNVYNVLLDSGKLPNLSTRMSDIMDWSDLMFTSLVGTGEGIT